MWWFVTATVRFPIVTSSKKVVQNDCDNGYWTTRGYANSRTANSLTGHLGDWSTRGLDNSRTGQRADTDYVDIK